MSEEINLNGVTSINWQVIDAEEGAPGITQRILWQGENDKRVVIYEFQPGSVYPGLDIHESGPEQVFVISGVFNDGQNNYSAGTFIHHPIDTSHAPQSKTGCVLLVIFPEG